MAYSMPEVSAHLTDYFIIFNLNFSSILRISYPFAYINGIELSGINNWEDHQGYIFPSLKD